MRRFDEYCGVTNLTVDDLNWPLISGIPLQRQRLTGATYYDDSLLDQNPWDEFSIDRFLEITSIQLITAGAGYERNDEITRFVFQRTMKTIVTYCNFMYDLARRNGKVQITRFELQDLIHRDEFRFYMYFRQFLPNPDPNCTAFSNHYTSLLHTLYFNIPGMPQFWNNSQMYNYAATRGQRLVQNIAAFYPPEYFWNEDESKYHTTFVVPRGTEFSKFYARRFHEALGMPPLENEIITVLDWLAKLCILEIVYHTTIWCDITGFGGLPRIEHYRLAMENVEDIIFDLAIDDFSISRLQLQISPFEISRYSPLDVSGYYETIKRKKDIEEYQNRFYEVHYSDDVRIMNVYATDCSRKR